MVRRCHRMTACVLVPGAVPIAELGLFRDVCIQLQSISWSHIGKLDSNPDLAGISSPPLSHGTTLNPVRRHEPLRTNAPPRLRSLSRKALSDQPQT